MKVSSVNSSLPVVRRNYKPVPYSGTQNSLTQITPVVVNHLVDNLVDEDDKENQKIGKGFYIIIDNENFSSIRKKIKSSLTPIQEQINKVYHLKKKAKIGVLVDMVV